MRVPRSQEQEQCALHESRPPLSMLRRELGIRRSSFEMLRNIDSTGWLLWPLFTWGNKTTWWPMIFHHRWSIHPNQTTIGEVNGPLTRKPRVGWLLIGKLKGLRKDNRRSTASTASHPCCLCLELIWPYLLALLNHADSPQLRKDGKARLFYLQNINSQHTRCFALVLGKRPISEMLLAIHDLFSCQF